MQPPEVAHILASLVRQETRVGSAGLHAAWLAISIMTCPMLQNPDRHAGFVVLKAADIPSVLVEMGFMSNPRGRGGTAPPRHRVMVASAMKRAVDAYFAATAHIAERHHAKAMAGLAFLARCSRHRKRPIWLGHERTSDSRRASNATVS